MACHVLRGSLKPVTNLGDYNCYLKTSFNLKMKMYVHIPFSMLCKNQNNDRYAAAVQFSSCDVNVA